MGPGLTPPSRAPFSVAAPHGPVVHNVGARSARCQWGPKFRDGSGVPSATVVPRPKKRSYGLWIKGEGHSLPLRWQSQREGPPPLDAFFASGSKAPNPLSGERALKPNDVFINIWGLRSGFIAGLGSGCASGTRKTRKANRAFRWLRQRNAKEKPLPVQETKPFPHVPPAPPKEEPFDRGFGGRENLSILKFRHQEGAPDGMDGKRGPGAETPGREKESC